MGDAIRWFAIEDFADDGEIETVRVVDWLLERDSPSHGDYLATVDREAADLKRELRAQKKQRRVVEREVQHLRAMACKDGVFAPMVVCRTLKRKTNWCLKEVNLPAQPKRAAFVASKTRGKWLVWGERGPQWRLVAVDGDCRGLNEAGSAKALEAKALFGLTIHQLFAVR